MKAGFFSILGYWLIANFAFAAAPSSDLLKVKKETEAKGYQFIAGHDEIVAKAKQEGSLRALLGFDPATIKAMKEGFRIKYPFINTFFEEITGTDSAQRFLLELKAGRASDWDVVHLSADFHGDYLPYLEKLDLLGMAEQGVLGIPPKVVSPKNRNSLAAGTIVDVAAYNRKLLPAQQAPKTWEDFLKPQYSGRKIIIDIRPNSLAALFPAMGKEWVLDYARKLVAQKPVWVRGRTRGLASIAAGEYPLFLGAYYHSVMRQKRREAQDLEVIVLEPIPVRLTETYGIAKGAKRSHAALLFLEYVMGAEGQKILDDIEPLKSSIYSPGSKLEQLVRGRKTSVINWEHIESQGEYIEQIFTAFGMPRVEK